METQNIKKLIENKAISDEDVLKALKEYLADKFDEKGEIIPPNENDLKAMEDLNILVTRLRPKVMEQFRQDFLKRHGENCPACQNMKRNQENT